MKKGWETKTIGDLCEFSRGLTYAKGDEVESSNNIVLRATNIDLTTNLLDFTELKYISDKVAVPDSKKVKRNSLIICTASGSKNHLGKVAFVDDDYDYAFGGFMGMLTPKNGLLPKYLFHRMTSEDYKDFIGALSDGANINNLKFDDLRRFSVPVPPLAEQQRIVGVLDEAFAGLATAQANAAKNLQNARALFKSHLQSVFTQRSQSAAEGRGKGWVEKPLVELCEVFFDSAHRTPKYQEKGIPALRPRDVVNGKLNLAGALRVSESEYEIQSKRYKPTAGDVVYSRELSYGWAAALPESPRVCLSQGMCVFRAAAKLGTAFLLYVLNGSVGREQATRFAVGAAHPHINLGDIKSYSIPFPPLAEQKQVVAKLDALATETQRLESLYAQKQTALAALKKSLLHQAFTGEL